MEVARSVDSGMGRGMLDPGSQSLVASKEGRKAASWLRCIKARAR